MAAQAQTFSAEDLAHRTIEVGIWGHDGRQVGGRQRVLAAPFYLPIWKDPLTYLEGPVDREPSCSLSVKTCSAQVHPPLLPCAEGMQVFPSLHPGSSTPRIQKGGTEPRRWPPNSFGGSHAFVMVVARIQACIAGHVEPRCPCPSGAARRRKMPFKITGTGSLILL